MTGPARITLPLETADRCLVGLEAILDGHGWDELDDTERQALSELIEALEATKG